jgi:hypothetical protein
MTTLFRSVAAMMVALVAIIGGTIVSTGTAHAHHGGYWSNNCYYAHLGTQSQISYCLRQAGSNIYYLDGYLNGQWQRIAQLDDRYSTHVYAYVYPTRMQLAFHRTSVVLYIYTNRGWMTADQYNAAVSASYSGNGSYNGSSGGIRLPQNMTWEQYNVVWKPYLDHQAEMIKMWNTPRRRI